MSVVSEDEAKISDKPVSDIVLNDSTPLERTYVREENPNQPIFELITNRLV